MTIKFDLDLADDGSSIGELLDRAMEQIETRDARVVQFVLYGPGGFNPMITIEAKDEATAFAIVDALYGDEVDALYGDSRESNRFLVYGID